MPVIEKLDANHVEQFFYDLYDFAMDLKKRTVSKKSSLSLPVWAKEIQTKEEVSLREKLDEIEKQRLGIKSEVAFLEKLKTLFTGALGLNWKRS